MANMLATATPLPSANAPLDSPWADSYTATLSEIRRSPCDSDDDYSDDEPALAVLRDDLRSTTERFFQRTPPHGRTHRSSSMATVARGPDAPYGLRQPQSWHGLQELEKCVGGLMRRQSGPAPSCHESHECGGGGPQAEVFVMAAVPPRESVGDGDVDVGVGGGVVRDAVGVSDDETVTPAGVGALVDPGLSLAYANAQQRLYMPTNDKTSHDSPNSSVATGAQLAGETPQRLASQDPTAVLKDLRARSEEATRTLEALQVLLMADGRVDAAATSENGGSTDRHQQQPGGAEATGQNGGAVATDVHGASNRMPLLLQAMRNVQQINDELRSALTTNPSGGLVRRHLRRGSSSFSLRRPGLGPRQQSRRFSPSALLASQMRSSSDLLQRRRSTEGQAEPMSCGLPRHRVQVSKRGAPVVYFELAITQARSTWTVERRMDEFVELRRSLVATATDLAAAAAAKRQDRSANLESQDVAQQQVGRSHVPGGGPDGKAGSLEHESRDYSCEAEARVPELVVDRSSLFEGTRFGSVLYGGRREEKLAEKQVVLASWLANILADRELMSPDLVRFLGGDRGGVKAQPVLADIMSEEAEDADTHETSESDSTSAYDSDDDDEDDDLGSEFDNLGEWPLGVTGQNESGKEGRTARFRLEKAMGKRVALSQGGSLTFPEVAHIMSMDQTHGSWGDGGRFFKRVGKRRAGGTEEDEDDEDEARTPVLVEGFSPCSVGERIPLTDDSASLRSRAPTPSSPTRRLTLDSFFRAPT